MITMQTFAGKDKSYIFWKVTPCRHLKYCGEEKCMYGLGGRDGNKETARKT
jgi:hypothetical protein